MNWICFAALIAACGAAKLDRTYLPPPSAASAGGSPGSLQTPLTRTSDQSHTIPPGGFINDHEGVVVEATLAGTRASDKKTGLGGSRESYGSTSSKVGDAAFRTTTPKSQSDKSDEYKDYDVSKEADLSAFYQPPNMFKPGNVQIVRDYVSDVIKHHNDIGLNKFNYGFETNNGIKTSVNGIAIDGVRAQGGFSYTGDDGREYSVSYIADEAGFRPQGSHLPTPHPIPAEILKALEKNAKDEAAGIIDDGSYDAKKYNVEYDYSQSGKYNDRLSNKLGHRPGLNSEMAMKQKQTSFEMSNFNGQFGFGFQTFKDKSNRPDANKFYNGNRNDIKNVNNLSKHEQSSSINGDFGSRNEYLPPKRVQSSNDYMSGNKYSFSVSPHLSHNVRKENNFGKPHSSSIRPSSFGSSPGPISQGTFPLQSSSVASNTENKLSTLNRFGAEDKNSPSNSSQPLTKPSQDNSEVDFHLSTNPSFTQQSTLNHGNDKVTSQNAQPSIPVFGFSSQSSQPLLQSELFSNVSPSQSSNTYLEKTKFNPMSTEYFSPSQYTTAHQTQYTNVPSSNFVTSFSSIIPTKQPDTILTTPLEESKTNEPSTSFDLNNSQLQQVTNLPDLTTTNRENLQFAFQTSHIKETLPEEFLSTTSGNTASEFSTPSVQNFNTNSQTTSFDIGNTQTTQLLQNTQVTDDVFSPQRPGDSDYASNTQRPSYYSQSNLFTGQAQGADHSYIYNRPSVPFHTPVAIHQTNNFPSKPLFSQFDRVTQSMTTPLDFTISTQYQSQHMNNNFQNPSTITTFSPSFSTVRENNSDKATFQASSDITQASISKFPTIAPTFSSTFEKQSTPVDLKPLQQSEFNTHGLASFTNTDSTLTTTTLAQSTAFSNTAENQSQGDTETTREIYEYNKPSQEEKEDVDLNEKTENPQFTVTGTQFTQENPTTMALEGKDVQTDQKESPLQFMQPNVKPEYSSYYKPSKFFPSTMTTETFATENQDTHTTTLSQQPTIGLQTSTQFANLNFPQTPQTTTQFDNKQSTSSEGSFQTKPEGTHYASMTERLSTQFPNNQPTQFETQSNTQFFGTKETTPNFKQPYQQTTTQFDYKPSTSNIDLFQTESEQSRHTTMTEKLSTQFPTNQPTQFETQFNTRFFDSKETTSNFQQPYQQTVTQFNYKPSTSIQEIYQTVPEQASYSSMTEKLSTQLPTNQPNEFSTSFFQSTDEPTTLFVQSTQAHQGNFYTKGTTTSQFQRPSQTLSTTFNEPLTSDLTTQTATPPKVTQFGEIYDYTKPTQGLQIPSQNNGHQDLVISQEKLHSVNHIDKPFSPQAIPIFQREKPLNFVQQTPESHYNAQSNNQEVISQTETSFTQPASQSTVQISTDSTLLPSTPQEQTAFELRVSEQASRTGEIYEYTKPTLGVVTENAKETTAQQFTQTAQVTNERYNTDLTTQHQNKQTTGQASTTGEIYEYTKPTQVSLTSQNVNYKQMSDIRPHHTTHIDTPFGPQFIPIFQREKPTHLAEQTYFSSGPTTENYSTENMKETTAQQFTQTGELTHNMQSTDLTTPDQNKQTADQASTAGEIYEYTKPTQVLPTSQNVNNEQIRNVKPQYATHIDLPFGPQIVPIFQRVKPTEYTEQTYFTSGLSAENYSTENLKETIVQKFTQTEQVTNKVLTDSTPQDQNKYTIDQASTTREIYEYTKPEQGLPSKKENVAFGQETQTGAHTTKSDEDYDYSGPTIGQSTQAPTTTVTTEKQYNFTQEIESNKGKLDSQKLAFHRACCNKFKVNNISTNIIRQNKNSSQLDKNENQKQIQANLAEVPGVPDLDPRRGSDTYAGIGEKFGGPRKPPSFDETGYHY